MKSASAHIITVNGGSSSVKFALFSSDERPARQLNGLIERVGSPDATLVVIDRDGTTIDRRPLGTADHKQAAEQIADWLARRVGNDDVLGVGHRIVHGGVHLVEHQVVTAQVMSALRDATSLDLAHLPREIPLIEVFQRRFTGVPQIACFDTAFHHPLPRVAKLLPIPRKYDEAGVRRLGFHGLSYTFLMDELGRLGGPDAAGGKVILAHLGSGASMAAVSNGRPIDTTMSFTPTAGLVMGTRSGDLDPGTLLYLMRQEKLTPEQTDAFVNGRCGLLGVSETSADMRDLLRQRDADIRAAEAVELFCYQARKYIGAFAAALDGLDTLVFAGGIGERSPEVRGEICQRLGFLGVKVDAMRNQQSSSVISADDSRVTVRVIPTDEEIVIARSVLQVLRERVGQ